MNFLKNIGTTELLIVAFVLLLLFGKKKLMELAQGLGESGRELKKVKNEFDTAFTKEEKPLNQKSAATSKKKGGGQ